MKSGEGYSYKTYTDNERDFIYNSINELGELVNSPTSAIAFDVENVFLTEKKALNELRETEKFIDKRLNQLLEIKKKYEYQNNSEYPLTICIQSYCEISNILKEIFESNEVNNFENPPKQSNESSQINISHSTIGQVNQSTSFSNSKVESQINDVSKQTAQKKSSTMQFWNLISENKLISTIISGIILAILFFIAKYYWNIDLK